MTENRLKVKKLQNYFNGEAQFEFRDIIEFYRQFEDDVKPTTVSWRTNTLVRKGILQRVGRGFYILGAERIYVPEISSKMKMIYKRTKKDFPYSAVCVWDTNRLNEFMVHQPNKFYLLLEVEKDAAESVFNRLRESNPAVFLEPKQDVFEKYLPEGKEPIIIKSLVSEAPVIAVEKIETASLEKMLVDVFCDEVTFSAQQGSEMKNIFDAAYAHYTVNHSKLLRYADRRGRKDELIKFTNLLARQN